MDARGGESNTQHVLFRRDVVLGRDTVQVIHVTERKETFLAQSTNKSVFDSTGYV